MTIDTTIAEMVLEEIAEDVSEGVATTTLADLIRLGSRHTEQARGWGGDERACALSAAGLAAVSLGVI